MAQKDLGKVVPERGVDYWTEADKQEIVEDVLQMTGLSNTYVSGTPVLFTIAATTWKDNSTVGINAKGYVIGDYGLQIGLPSETSVVNAQAVIKAALTICECSTTNSTTAPNASIYIVAIEPPTIDVEIAIFGLVPKEAEAS